MKNNRTFTAIFPPLYKHLFYWALTFILFFILSHTPWFIEKVYSAYLYPVIAVSNRWFFSFFSFSAGDVLYVLVLVYFVFLMINFVTGYKNFKENLLRLSRFFLLIIWVFYFSWGLNYFRPGLSRTLGMQEEKYKLDELVQLGRILKDSTNKYQKILTENDSLPVQVTYGINRILNKTPAGYEKISGYLNQKYTVPVIKTSLLSKPISYLHVTGYLNPFTGEAQINKNYPKFALPFVASHEVAHQLGYAPEDEANFLGYLSSVSHPDPYFKYSGYSAALYYVLIELKKYAPEKYKILMQEINKGVKKNYAEEYRFYQKHKTKYDASKIYDSYLKVNKQESGIKSYNEMLKLLVAYYKLEVPLIKAGDSLSLIKK